MPIDYREAVKYILYRSGCLHPFRISRILGLAEIICLEERGERLTNANYRGFDNVFYIEGLKEVFETDECFRIREGDPSRNIRGCVEYICGEPVIPREYALILDKALEKASSLNDEELNKLVLENSLFKKLIQPIT